MSRRGRGRYLARVKPPLKKCYLFMEGVLRPHFWTHYRVGSGLQEDQFRFCSDLLRRPQEDENMMMRRHYWACPVETFWGRRSCLPFCLHFELEKSGRKSNFQIKLQWKFGVKFEWNLWRVTLLQNLEDKCKRDDTEDWEAQRQYSSHEIHVISRVISR